MKQPEQEKCPDCIDGKVFNQQLPTILGLCPTCHGTGLKPDPCSICEYEKDDSGCIQIICPHQIEPDPEQETAGMGEPVFYQPNETGTSYRVTEKSDSKLWEKVEDLIAKRFAALMPDRFLLKGFPRRSLTGEYLAKEILALLPDEAEIRKQERKKLLNELKNIVSVPCAVIGKVSVHDSVVGELIDALKER